MIDSFLKLIFGDPQAGIEEHPRNPFFRMRFTGVGQAVGFVGGEGISFVAVRHFSHLAMIYQEQQQLLAKAIQAEGIAEAKGIREMNNALVATGGEVIVKLRIAEALQGKRIMLLPVSEGGMNLKTTDINRLIETLGVKSLFGSD